MEKSTPFSIPTFIINMGKRADRRRHVENQFRKYPEFEVSFFPAIQDAIPAVGQLRKIDWGIGSGIGSDGGRSCYCGTNADCLVSGSEEHTCTQICKVFEDGC